MLCALVLIALSSTPTAVQLDEVERGGVRYHVVTSKPAQVRIVLSDGVRLLRNFSAVHRFLVQRGEMPLVLMNGGIFEPTGIPSGLLIQDGEKLRPLNLAEEKGNFYLKPDGVFLTRATTATVIDSLEFPAEADGVRFAV